MEFCPDEFWVRKEKLIKKNQEIVKINNEGQSEVT